MKINFQFNYKTNSTDIIFYFPDTNLVCIAQMVRLNTDFFKLTYFNFPLS